MTVARSVARSVVQPVARAVTCGLVGGLPYPSLCNTDFSSWTAEGLSQTTGQTDVNGASTATLLTTTATTNEHRIYKIVGSSASKRAIVAKAGTANFIGITPTGVDNNYARFDLALGTVVAQENGTASITGLGNGWFLCEFTPIVSGIFLILKIGETTAQAVPGTSYLGTGKSILVSGATVNEACV